MKKGVRNYFSDTFFSRMPDFLLIGLSRFYQSGNGGDIDH